MARRLGTAVVAIWDSKRGCAHPAASVKGVPPPAFHRAEVTLKGGRGRMGDGGMEDG